MSLLDAQQFLTQQAAIAAQSGNLSLSNILNSQLAGAQSTHQVNDPYASYLTGVQNYANSEDQLYGNALQNLFSQGNTFANSYQPSQQLLQSAPGAVNPGDPNYQQYVNALTSQSNEYQDYLNTENQDLQNYQNTVNQFQNTNQQQNQQSNQALLTENEAAQNQAISNTAAQNAQQQNQAATQKLATEAKQQAYALPLVTASAVGSQTSQSKVPTSTLAQKLFPQTNATGGGSQVQPQYNFEKQSNSVSGTPPPPNGQSNMIIQQPLPPGAQGNSNQIFG